MRDVNDRNMLSCTLSELWRIRRRWSLSLSRGSLTRRTNERLYSRRLADLWSAEEARLVCSRARYKSPRESACILQSRAGPGEKETLSLTNSLMRFGFLFYSKIYLNGLYWEYYPDHADRILSAVHLSPLQYIKQWTDFPCPHSHTNWLNAICPAWNSKGPKLL